MTHNSSVNFKLTHFLLWIKGSHQIFNSETSKCSGKNLPNHKSVFLQILHHFSVSWKLLLCIFLAQTFYTLFKRSPLICTLLRLLSARVKIPQITYVNFETTAQFPNYKSVFLQILRHSSVSWKSWFCRNHIKFQLKKYRGVISHATEEWYIV